jgi:hypothetical protein
MKEVWTHVLLGAATKRYERGVQGDESPEVYCVAAAVVGQFGSLESDKHKPVCRVVAAAVVRRLVGHLYPRWSHEEAALSVPRIGQTVSTAGDRALRDAPGGAVAGTHPASALRRLLRGSKRSKSGGPLRIADMRGFGARIRDWGAV